MGGRTVVTSAHVVGGLGARVEVFHPGASADPPGKTPLGGTVVWCGTPGGRDDAALVLVDDDTRWRAPVAPVRWGRLITDRPGTACETWGVPNAAQREGRKVEAVQLRGEVNPGTGFAGNQHVFDLVQNPPVWPGEGSPWGGLSGAAVFGDRLLFGVVASDRAFSGHGQLNFIPAYVLFHDPGFRAVLAEQTGWEPGLEAVEFQSLAGTAPAGGKALRSPAALLEAGRQTVPFRGRAELLERLVTWCEQDGFGAWLLHGPGGQGKTRLAHELGHQLGQRTDSGRWAVLWPHADGTGAGLRELSHALKPLLVVLDYAENRTHQITALVEAAAEHSGNTPFKLLLLARTGGDWWTRAKSATGLADEYLDGAPAHLLEPLESDRSDRARAYRDAAQALAETLPRVNGCADTNWQAAADALPVPALGQEGYGNALTLHMTALADLLDTAARPTTPETETPMGPATVDQGVEDRLLGHERRYWVQTATTQGLSAALGLPVLETALAAAHLVGAGGDEQADRIWCSLPALADQPRTRRDGVTAWIGGLYPPTASGRPWGGLQPDRLAERHLGRVLDNSPALAERLLKEADETQSAHLLDLYARAASHPVFEQRLDTALTALCVRHHRQLAAQTVTTATRTDHPAPLIAALDTLSTDPTTQLDDLNVLHDRLPYSSRRLAHTAVRLTQSMTSRYREVTDSDPSHLPGLATCLNNLSIRLGDLGRREEGLAAIREAVEIRRLVAHDSPDTFLPDLATSLSNLSVQLGGVGRHEEGLSAALEAVEIRRVLAESSPGAHLPDLAMSLSNLAVRLGHVGKHEEGLEASHEAILHYRQLADASPEAYVPHLANSLSNRSVQLGDIGRHEEGLSAALEAVEIRRVLAESSPDAHLPDLAMSLSNLSVQLGGVGRHEDGLSAIQEAVEIRRRLSAASPDAYQPNLATSLTNLSAALSAVGRQEEGLVANREAVGHHRQLAAVSPDAYLPALGTALSHLSVQLADAGHHEEGLAAMEEAVGLYRELAAANPAAHLPYLAVCLTHLAALLQNLGRRDGDLEAVDEAVGLYRQLAAANAAYLPDLAVALTNFALRLGGLGRAEDGLSALDEAVGLYRELAGANPAAHLPGLALALRYFSVLLNTVGRCEEALTAVDEAVGLYRELAGVSPAAYLPELAASLINLAARLEDDGRHEEGLTAVDEAVGLYRELTGANPAAYLPDLAVSLNNLAVQLGHLERREEGLTAIREAADHYRQLTLGNAARFEPNLQASLEVADWLESLPSPGQRPGH
ncbi:tetratricopeptide repeat protein [Streptomyces sp. NPDC056534]|uniref:tetratricopeptide repeat protein n=2 Tax=unclassified Streptomyces TaxID=2593676 RepID=UPI0036AECB27